MKPGIVCTGLNFCDSLATFVESAELGRNDELSFFWTSASLPCTEAPAPPISRIANAMAPTIHTPGVNRLGLAVLAGGFRSSVRVMQISSWLGAQAIGER